MRHSILIVCLILVLAWRFIAPASVCGAPLEEEDLPAAPVRPLIPDSALQRGLQPTPVYPPKESREQRAPPYQGGATAPAERAPSQELRRTEPLGVPARHPSPEPSHSAVSRPDAPVGTAEPSDVLAADDALSAQERIALRFVAAGKEALEQNNPERARERFDRAISIAPLQPYAYYFLGRIALDQGELKHALAFLQKAELLFSQDQKTWLGEATCLRGIVAEDMESYEIAREAYQQCLRFVPNNLRALSALARLPKKEPVFDESLSYGVLNQ